MTEDEVLQRINRDVPQRAQASPMSSAAAVSVGTILKCYGDVQVVPDRRLRSVVRQWRRRSWPDAAGSVLPSVAVHAQHQSVLM